MSFLCMKVLNWRDIGGPDWVWFTGAGDCACKVLEWSGEALVAPLMST